ncbi:MAG TPA: GxxExxY protein [Anditalea sp.]|nr:GxxExxY protein [Anditalea sp.]
MELNKLTERIIGASIDVHKALGPGLLENVYKQCLHYKLQKEGIFVEKEKNLPVVFEGVTIDCGYKIDLLVEEKVVIELKSVSEFNNIHTAQMLTYLKLGKYDLGLLINFNVDQLIKGVKRLRN